MEHSLKSTEHKQQRARPTVDQKCAIISELKALEESDIPLPQKVCLTMHPAVSAKNLSTWSKLRTKLFSAQEQGFGNARYLTTASRVRFADQETKLYIEFVYRRKILGMEAPDGWLQWGMGKVTPINDCCCFT